MRFTLSYRDVEDLLAERGLDISYETVRCWVLKFGAGDRATATPVLSTAERSLAPRRDGGVDRRPRMYLWRAFDHESEVLDCWFSASAMVGRRCG